jgi:serine/threonine protein kinase
MTPLDSAVQGLCARCLLDLAMAAREPADEAAAFRTITLLGRGPHGATYLAEQDGDARLVSLKILEGDAARAASDDLASIRDRLMDASHESLVPLIDVRLDPTPSVAAAYLQGRRVRPSDADPLPGLRDLASALAHLHECGIVHGNVHAGNVLALSTGPGRSRASWCLIDLAAARPLATGADAILDLLAYGRLMREVVTAPSPGLLAILARAARAGTPGGYETGAQLLQDLLAL